MEVNLGNVTEYGLSLLHRDGNATLLNSSTRLLQSNLQMPEQLTKSSILSEQLLPEQLITSSKADRKSKVGFCLLGF